MDDIEYEIMDELYFVISFNDLKEKVSIDENDLIKQLQRLIKKEWVRCFKNISGDELSGDVDLKDQYMNYYYLASKEGLKAHNSL